MKQEKYQKLNNNIAWRIFNVIYLASTLSALIIYINKSLLSWSIPWYFRHFNDVNAIFFPTKESLIFLSIILGFIIFYFIIRHLTIYIVFNK